MLNIFFAHGLFIIDTKEDNEMILKINSGFGLKNKQKNKDILSSIVLPIFLQSSFLFALSIEILEILFMPVCRFFKRFFKNKETDRKNFFSYQNKTDFHDVMPNVDAADILATKDSSIKFGALFIGHTGLIYDSYHTIESSPCKNGVYESTMDDWMGKNSASGKYDGKTVYILKCLSKFNKKYLTNWIYTQVGRCYNFNFFNRCTNKSYYCSQLVWFAYLKKADINLCPKIWNIVSPSDILKSKKLKIYYSREYNK